MKSRSKNKKENSQKCIVEICKRKVGVKKHQLCLAHYVRWRAYGDIHADFPIRHRRSLEPYKPRKQ